MLGALIRRVVVLLAIAGIAVGSATGSAGAVSPTPPRIAASPNDLMVNTDTTLTGTGFAKHANLIIEECSRTNWVVMGNPCIGSNHVSVTTDAHGKFVTQFRVVLCGGRRGPEPTSQICYIGHPRPNGVDTERLVGAAKVTVTYP